MKKLCLMIATVFMILTGLIDSFGQEIKTESGKAYKIYTYTVAGSRGAANNAKLPNNLAKAFEGIKNDGGYSGYRLLSTQYQLIKRDGNISYKSILKSTEISGETGKPIFADWNYLGFTEDGKQAGFKSFRFNMRFPLKSTSVNDNGQNVATTGYEQIGLSAQNIDFRVGEPVLFASFPVGITDKMLFFIVDLEEVD